MSAEATLTPKQGNKVAYAAERGLSIAETMPPTIAVFCQPYPTVLVERNEGGEVLVLVEKRLAAESRGLAKPNCHPQSNPSA